LVITTTADHGFATTLCVVVPFSPLSGQVLLPVYDPPACQSSPGCWMPMNIVFPSGVVTTPVGAAVGLGVAQRLLDAVPVVAVITRSQTLHTLHRQSILQTKSTPQGYCGCPNSTFR
jgi:hypothetical protein